MRALGEAELVVALHSCSADTLEYIQPLREALKARRGRFLMLVGNEYNLPWAPLGEKRRFPARGRRRLGRDAAAARGRAMALRRYGRRGAAAAACRQRELCFAATSRSRLRPIDIGGRSFRYPVFLGDDERNRVYDLFAELGPAAGLRVDIDTDSRLDRPAGPRFSTIAAARSAPRPAPGISSATTEPRWRSANSCAHRAGRPTQSGPMAGCMPPPGACPTGQDRAEGGAGAVAAAARGVRRGRR